MASWFFKQTEKASQPRLTGDEAIARAQAYAKEHDSLFEAPFDVHMETRRMAAGAETSGEKIPVYVIRSVRYLPMSLIEIDAVNGAVLKHQTFPQ